MSKTTYWAEVKKLGSDATTSRHTSTVSPERAIQNARSAVLRIAKRRGLAVDKGEPHWTSGCLTWTYSQGFIIGGERRTDDIGGDYTWGGEMWRVSADSSMTHEHGED